MDFVTPLKSVGDLLLGLSKLTREKWEDRRAVFNAFIEPTHNRLTEVHGNYSEFFRETIACAANAQDRFALAETPHALADAKQLFIAARKQREHLRDLLRQEAALLYSNTPVPEFRRYFVAVVHYFLEDQGHSLSDAALDRVMEEVARVGGVSYYDTPSTRMEAELLGTTKPQGVEAILRQKLAELNERFVAAHLHYTRAKMACFPRV